jgi:flagellar protein FliO/FliZ
MSAAQPTDPIMRTRNLHTVRPHRLHAFAARLSPAAIAAALASAECIAAEQAAAAPAVSMGSMLQMLLGLAVVLALVAGIAWVMKRFALTPGAAGGAIKIIGGASVGTRERVVLLEIAGTWLVVGVAPGQVRALHTMPKSEIVPDAHQSAAGRKTFQQRLKQMMEKHHAK